MPIWREIDYHLGHGRCEEVDSGRALVDRSYGARPLRRALQRYVEAPCRRR